MRQSFVVVMLQPEPVRVDFQKKWNERNQGSGRASGNLLGASRERIALRGKRFQAGEAFGVAGNPTGEPMEIGRLRQDLHLWWAERSFQGGGGAAGFLR